MVDDDDDDDDCKGRLPNVWQMQDTDMIVRAVLRVDASSSSIDATFDSSRELNQSTAFTP